MGIQSEIGDCIDKQNITSVQANRWWDELNIVISRLIKEEEE